MWNPRQAPVAEQCRKLSACRRDQSKRGTRLAARARPPLPRTIHVRADGRGREPADPILRVGGHTRHVGRPPTRYGDLPQTPSTPCRLGGGGMHLGDRHPSGR